MADYQYWEMLDEDRVYAVCRSQGALVERWSPQRGQWKEATFHVDDVLFNQGSAEKRSVSEAEAEKTIHDEVLPDVSDEDWAQLSHPVGQSDAE